MQNTNEFIRDAAMGKRNKSASMSTVYDRVVKSYVHNTRGLDGPKVALHEFAGARQLKKTAPQRSPKSCQHLVPQAQWTDSLNNMLLSQKSWSSPGVRGNAMLHTR